MRGPKHPVKLGNRLANSSRSQAPNRVGSLSVQQMSGGGTLDGRGRLWAVVIGVSNYKKLAPKERLEFAHRDAKAVDAYEKGLKLPADINPQQREDFMKRLDRCRKKDKK